MLARLSTVLAIVGATAVASCASGEDEGAGDAGVAPLGDTDSGAGDSSPDAAPASMDTGPSPVDTGTAMMDTGTHKDTGSSPVDSGTSVDTGTIDSSSAGTPTTCAQANDMVGCCAAGVAYYCKAASPTTLTSQTCTSGKVCGWNATSKYYGCVASPGGADPSGMDPIACQ